jgi:hypothetical protein
VPGFPSRQLLLREGGMSARFDYGVRQFESGASSA